MSEHFDFILSEGHVLVEDAARALASVQTGMLNRFTCDYILQAAFLAMTGYLEQKMKCVCWEVASRDYEFRSRDFDNDKLQSSYADKRDVLNNLIRSVDRIGGKFVPNNIGKGDILTRTVDSIKAFRRTSGILGWGTVQYEEAVKLFDKVSPGDLLVDDGKGDAKRYDYFWGRGRMTEGMLSANRVNLCYLYEEVVYRHRNRCAHNTLSYQINHPELGLLSREEFIYHSYLIRFFILLIIDEIIRQVFRQWARVAVPLSWFDLS